jgi:hypothetical protein
MSSPQQPPQPLQQPTPDSTPHVAAQVGLAVLTTDAIERLWPSLDLRNLRNALPAFKAAVAQQVQRSAQASASLAARQYALQRRAAGVSGSFSAVPADPPTVEQIAQSVDWAVQPLWNADVAAHAAAGGTAVIEVPTEVAKVAEEAPPAGSAIADAKARLAAASERLVLDTGRQTVIDNAERDRKAKGWARVPEPGACSFCLMLATRGAVYRSEASGGFKTHDNCRCHVEPVFNAYEPSADVRQAQALWASSTRGKSGNAARIAFRQAVEGRTAPKK